LMLCAETKAAMMHIILMNKILFINLRVLLFI